MRTIRRSTAALAVALMATALFAASAARAGAPMVIPQTNYDGYPKGTQQHLSPPAKSEDYQYYPEQGRPVINTQYSAVTSGALDTSGGFFSLFGDTVADGNAVVWDDIGSGVPVVQGVLNRWRFELPGLYAWHCTCATVGTHADGKVYVVGPRPRILPTMISPDNTAPVRYTLDGSESNVTDWKPYTITKYEWDLNEDGIYSGQPPDQSGPEPMAAISFDTPGAHTVGLRVTDNFGSDPMDPGFPRVVDAAITINVPKPTTATSGDTRPAQTDETADKKATFAGTYGKQNVKLSARAKVSIATLRKNGLVVKVTGIRNGDVVSAKLTKALKKKKTRQVAAKSGRSDGTSLTLRIRLKKSAFKVLRAKPKAKSIRLAVKVEGSDGFTVTKAKNVKLG
jgi:hypothetical protein